MSWEDSLILEDNEKIIQFWRGDYEVQYTVFEDGLFGKEPKKAKKQKKGILVLTNRKIVFLEERGFLVLTYHVKELFDLGAIDLLAFFTALAIKVYELCENGIKVEEEAKKRFESFLIDVTNLTQEEDELIRRSFRVPLSGRLRFKLN